MSRIFDALRKSEQDRPAANGNSRFHPDFIQPPVPTGQAVPDDLGRIPIVQLAPSISIAGDATDSGAEAFRVLRHRLELIRRQRPLRKLLIASAVPEEGKTTVACRLAAAFVQGGARVLLIDADLRHPGVHRALGIPPQRGIGEWLEGRDEIPGILRRLEPSGCFYLPAGHAQSNPGELLRRQAFGEFLTSTTATFDWVVIDSPPLGPFVDAHFLATLVDGVLITLRCGVTPRAAIEQVAGSLGRVFVAGAVVNGVTDRNGSYYRYYDSEKSGDPGAQAHTHARAAGNGRAVS